MFKISRLSSILLCLAISEVAFADDCLDKAEQVRLKFAAVHDELTEDDHARVETLLGQAYGQCDSAPSQADINLSEAESILTSYQ